MGARDRLVPTMPSNCQDRVWLLSVNLSRAAVRFLARMLANSGLSLRFRARSSKADQLLACCCEAGNYFGRGDVLLAELGKDCIQGLFGNTSRAGKLLNLEDAPQITLRQRVADSDVDGLALVRSRDLCGDRRGDGFFRCSTTNLKTAHARRVELEKAHRKFSTGGMKATVDKSSRIPPIRRSSQRVCVAGSGTNRLKCTPAGI